MEISWESRDGANRQFFRNERWCKCIFRERIELVQLETFVINESSNFLRTKQEQAFSKFGQTKNICEFSGKQKIEKKYFFQNLILKQIFFLFTSSDFSQKIRNQINFSQIKMKCICNFLKTLGITIR